MGCIWKSIKILILGKPLHLPQSLRWLTPGSVPISEVYQSRERLCTSRWHPGWKLSGNRHWRANVQVTGLQVSLTVSDAPCFLRLRFSLRWRSCGVGGACPSTGKGRPPAAATGTARCSPRWRTAAAASRRGQPALAWCSSPAKRPAQPAASPTATWLYPAASGAARSRTARRTWSARRPRRGARGCERRFPWRRPPGRWNWTQSRKEAEEKPRTFSELTPATSKSRFFWWCWFDWPCSAWAAELKIQGSKRYFPEVFRLHGLDSTHSKDPEGEVSVE